MRTTSITSILCSRARNRASKIFAWANPVEQLLALGALVAFCSMPNTAALVYSINIVGVVADRTTELLTAPLTTEQRQVLHAKNFSQLPTSARPLYLRGVAYSIGFIVQSDGEALPSSATVADYLESASFGASSFENLSDLSCLAHKAVVNEVMRELNVLIALQLANNTTLQHAMELGAIDSFFDVFTEAQVSVVAGESFWDFDWWW
jgi:hypothetical protein